MVDLNLFFQQIIIGITLGVIYAYIAIGLTLIYGVLRILHIAHAAVYSIGALSAYSAFVLTNNMFLSLLSALASSALLGFSIEKFLYRPLINRPPFIILILSVALFILIEELAANFWGHYSIGFYTNISDIVLRFSIVSITLTQLILLFSIIIVLFFLWLFLNKTKTGLASKALMQDPEITVTLGINNWRIIDINFIIGSMLAGIAGFLVGLYYSQVSPFMGDVVAYKALIVIVLGGFGSIFGALLGGIILGISEAMMVLFLGNIFPPESFAFMVLILTLIIRPQGILGKIE